MMRFKSLLFFALFVFASALPLKAQVNLVNLFPKLYFDHPVGFEVPDDGTGRVFIVEQPGTIYIVENDTNASRKNAFLDLTGKVNYGGELGLLGLAFHPNFAGNGYFYVDYTTGSGSELATIISRFSVSASDPNSADPASEQVLLRISQPNTNHNGGQLQFGPDSYLYIAMGDGGHFPNGQDRTTLLGKILRIDVDNPQNGMNYGVPADNPFAGNDQGYREEIWAYGLRNPWRFNFDYPTGRLWAGDVGQDSWEEIDIIGKGRNYGWDLMEGDHCYSVSNCDTTGLQLPVWEYAHDASGGEAITGGFVYRGSDLPDLVGKYIYADYLSGHIWALTYNGPNSVQNELLLDTGLKIPSFGTDRNNELYICAFNGNIYKFSPTTTPIGETAGMVVRQTRLKQNYPNPFNPTTTISFSLQNRGRVKLMVFNISGKEVGKLADRVMSPGQHSVVWNGRGENGEHLPSGIYFYRLFLDDKVVRTRSMVLLK